MDPIDKTVSGFQKVAQSIEQSHQGKGSGRLYLKIEHSQVKMTPDKEYASSMSEVAKEVAKVADHLATDARYEILVEKRGSSPEVESALKKLKTLESSFEKISKDYQPEAKQSLSSSERRKYQETNKLIEDAKQSILTARTSIAQAKEAVKTRAIPRSEERVKTQVIPQSEERVKTQVIPQSTVSRSPQAPKRPERKDLGKAPVMPNQAPKAPEKSPSEAQRKRFAGEWGKPNL